MKTPIYQNIVNDIVLQINTGKLKSGDKLNSERKMMQKYDVSDTSVKRAMSILKESGYICKRHGSGNYVLDKVSVSGSESPDILIACHDQFGSHARMTGMLQRLSEACKNIKIQAITVNSPEISAAQAEKLLEQYSCPIIFINSRNQTAEMAEAGLLTDMHDIPGMIERIDNMPDNLKWQFKGLDEVQRYYASPYLYIPSCMAVNLSLAEEAGLDLRSYPETWEDFLELCRKFTEWKTENHRNDLFASFSYRNFMVIGKAYYFLAAEGHPYDMSEEDSKKAIREVADFANALIKNKYIDAIGVQAPDPFVSGKYLFHLHACSWIPRDMQRYNPDLKYKMFPLPLPESGRPRFSRNGTSLLSVAAKTQTGAEKKNLKMILDEIFSDEWSIELAWYVGGVPSLPSAFRNMIKKHPEHQIFYDSIFTSLEPHFPKDDNLEKAFGEFISRRMKNENYSVEMLCDDMLKAYSAICLN